MNNNVSPTKKSKRKFNLIDFFIVVIILALVFAIVYALSPWSHIKKLLNTNEVNIQYTVEFKNVDGQLKEKIESQDIVTNSVTKNAMGVVSDIEIVKSSKLYYKDADGNIVGDMIVDEEADEWDIKVQIVATANYEPNVGYSVNGTRVAIGEQLSLRFPEFVGTGYCTNLD